MLPLISFSQVGIGTNTIHSSAKLQIESTNKGFLQPRVTLTGTGDNTTITSPATGLMVFNTATAGSGSTAVTPGVYYYSGSAWQRLSDNNPTTFVNGSFISSTGYTGNIFIIAPGYASSFNLGSITLPPGKWEVVLNIMNYCSQGMGTIAGCHYYMNYWLQNTNTAEALSFAPPANITNITADGIFTGAASFTGDMGENAMVLNKGSFYINNSTAGNKTYYLFAKESTPCGDPVNDDHSPIYGGLGSTNYKQNRFYAVKIY